MKFPDYKRYAARRVAFISSALERREYRDPWMRRRAIDRQTFWSLRELS